MSDLEHEQNEARRLLDRHRYYGETLPAEIIETLQAVVDVDVDQIRQDSYDQGLEDSTVSDEICEERDKLQDQVDELQVEVEDLKKELNEAQEIARNALDERDDALLKPKRRVKDPFKGKTPTQMRQALKIIYGALSPYLED